MRPFQFRLEPLLEIAAGKEQRALRYVAQREQALREAAAAVDECEKRQAARQEEGRAATERLRTLEDQAIQAGADYSGRLRLARERIAGLEAECQNAANAVRQSQIRFRQAETDLQLARQLHTGAVQYRQRLEKLKDEDREEYRREMERQDIAELNEIAATMFYLNLVADREEEALRFGKEEA